MSVVDCIDDKSNVVVGCLMFVACTDHQSNVVVVVCCG